MEETDLARQIKAHMALHGITQVDLGRRIVPDSKNPGQIVSQYLTGQRQLLTGNAKAILDALGLEITIQPKRDS